MDSAKQEMLFEFRNARHEDHADIRSLLSECGLPTQDLSDESLDHFIICLSDGALVGVVGLELYGPSGLVRSLAVAGKARSQGIAVKLLSRIQQRARELGVARLFALTMSAQRYMEKHGFAVIEREQVPKIVRATAQFVELCPESAVCLTKSLDRNSH